MPHKHKHRPLDEASVSALARKTDTPVEEIRKLYAQEVADLESTANVKNFIDVIASRRVKERLRARA